MLERFAVWITKHVGSVGFFLIIVLWTSVWLGWNIFAPSGLQFDPFPAFVLWLFISNMIQIFLMPLIMIGQNVQGRHSEKILAHLENQSKRIEHVIERLGSQK